MNIKLNSGREIYLESIWQHQTYGGLLCGVPNEEMNKEYIEDNMNYALEKMNAECTYLVPPVSLELDNIDKKIKRYKDAIRLPYITCFAQFESSVLTGDESNNGSWLTIVWYQDDFPMPIDDAVLEHIKSIDWESKAEGFEL
ncbi:MAG: TIGR02996 domain-containing protein [uncultured Sulfurovum sp.]|uniref:TIGR02996 domain-containing protein n=1 Tax=uncultured Sulfurovum sp. TaxID=269237 RepID=A0A6S6S4I7_9BACT|nr:MAG: TIGR02996 domain-containing protein [uncultured Sulfurovum sp.]